MNENNSEWFLYVVECSDGTFYTGITKDIDRRVKEHNSGSRGAKYTKTRRPVRLLGFKAYLNQGSALRAELKFKKLSHGKKLAAVEKM